MALAADALLAECLELQGLYVEERDELVRCFVLRLAAASPAFDPDNPDHVERAEQLVARAIARRAPRLRSPRARPSRIRWPRAPRARKPRESGCMSCGSKRACRNHTITRQEAMDWFARNCQTGERARRPGPAVGGTLAEARRAPGLWDQERPVESGATPGDPGWNPRAAEAAAALRQEALARGAAAFDDPNGIMTARATELGGASWLGIGCQADNSTMSCFDPRTGLNRSWYVVGRRFTPQEQAAFMREQCTPRCDRVSVAAGAPLDAKTSIRRVAPRNPSVKSRIDCKRGAPRPTVPGLALRPLPPLAARADAIAPAPACVPDTVVGVDGGMFGSGWFIVIRNGVRILTPNPEGCGQDITAAFR